MLPELPVPLVLPSITQLEVLVLDVPLVPLHALLLPPLLLVLMDISSTQPRPPPFVLNVEPTADSVHPLPLVPSVMLMLPTPSLTTGLDNSPSLVSVLHVVIINLSVLPLLQPSNVRLDTT
jgi:hypothetical protein